MVKPLVQFISSVLLMLLGGGAIYFLVFSLSKASGIVCAIAFVVLALLVFIADKNGIKRI